MARPPTLGEALRELAERAEAGRITGVAVAYRGPEGCGGSLILGVTESVQLVGEVAVIAQALTLDLIELRWDEAEHADPGQPAVQPPASDWEH